MKSSSNTVFNRYDIIQIQIVYIMQHHQIYRSCMKAIYSTTTPTIVLCTPSIFQSLLFFRHTKKNIFIAGGAYQSSMQKNCWTTNLVFVKLTLGFIVTSICSMSLFIALKCINIRNQFGMSCHSILSSYLSKLIYRTFKNKKV